MSDEIVFEEEKTIRMKAIFMYVTDVIVYSVLIGVVLLVPSVLHPLSSVLDGIMSGIGVSWRPQVFVATGLLLLLLLDAVFVIPFRLFISR